MLSLVTGEVTTRQRRDPRFWPGTRTGRRIVPRLSAYPYISSADLQVGCLVGLLAHTRTLAAWTPPVQPLWRAALLESAIYG
jgi:hypothetical protein